MNPTNAIASLRSEVRYLSWIIIIVVPRGNRELCPAIPKGGPLSKKQANLQHILRHEEHWNSRASRTLTWRE